MKVDDNDVQFDEDMPTDGQFHIRSPKILGEKETPGVIVFLLDKNIVKNEKQATGVIIVIVILFLLLSGWVLRSTFADPQDLKVIDKYGQEITIEEYIKSINSGKDPLK